MKIPFAVAIAAAALGAGAQEPAAKVSTYALVSAVGSQFNFVSEKMRTGSHLPPYNRSRAHASGELLDKLVLHGLEGAVAKADPFSKRVHLSVAVRPGRTDTSGLEDAAMQSVLEKLRALPERQGWDRIILATPAYRPLDGNAMPGRIQGMGIFAQPLCATWDNCDFRTSVQSGGQQVTTPDGRTVSSSRFIAPYVSLRVSILDPKTLAVVESQEVFSHEKYFDPMSDSMDMMEMVPKRFLAMKLIELVEVTAREAVAQTQLRGQVEVKEPGAVKEGTK